MKKNLICLSALALMVACLISTQALALNVQSLRPSPGFVKGFQVFTSESLPKYYLAVGITTNLSNHPLEQTPAGATNRVAGVVDQFVTADFLVSYGVTNWLDINLDIPVGLYHNIAPTFIPNRDKGGGDMGDISLNTKITLYNANVTKTHLGLAVIPFITLPTGRESIYFGDANVTGGLILAGDWQLKSNRFYINFGTRFRESENINNNLLVDHEFIYGLGFERPLVKHWDLDVILELYGSTNYDNFLVEDISSPLEGFFLLKKQWLKNKNLTTYAGAGMGLTNGYSLPNVRVIGGVSYAFNAKPKKRKIIKLEGKVHFDFDKAKIKTVSYPVLDKVVKTMKKYSSIKHVTIEGHTDSKGSDSYNRVLSHKRANAIKKYMLSKGIAAKRLSTVGLGETQPIASNTTEKGRYMNRRSVFVIDK
jgi:outer membrane protein OmpA-like peptidoglycan-associated protein